MALVVQHAGGDQVELGIIRNGNPLSVTVTLAKLLPPVILTPSAEITMDNNARLVVDIGFDGATGILVLEGQVHVREPITGSEVDVPAGSVVIVEPGYEIGVPIPVSESDITTWWSGEQQPTPVPPEPGPSPVPLVDLAVYHPGGLLLRDRDYCGDRDRAGDAEEKAAAHADLLPAPALMLSFGLWK